MTAYRIICVTQDKPDPHRGHILNVGTGPTPAHYTRKWTVDQVWSATLAGDTFHTIGPKSGKRASVHRFECTICGRRTLRSGPDAVTDNNLDSLPSCA
jgi:hypothetical protein